MKNILLLGVQIQAKGIYSKCHFIFYNIMGSISIFS